MGDHTTSITQALTSIDGIEAEYTLRIDNNGRVAGVVLRSELDNGAAAVSSMAVVADKFVIASPDGAQSQSPFVVYTTPQVIGGVTIPAGVYMRSAMIQDAAITGRLIAPNVVSSWGQTHLMSGTLAAGAGVVGTPIFIQKPPGYYFRFTITGRLSNSRPVFDVDSFIGFAPEVRRPGEATWLGMTEMLCIPNIGGSEAWSSGSIVALFDPSDDETDSGLWGVRQIVASNSATADAQFGAAKIIVEVIRK